MSSRYGGFDDKRVVPLAVAQQLLEQRDRLVAELQTAKRANDKLEAQRRAAAIDREELERRAVTAEKEAASLRERLAEAAATEGKSAPSESTVDKETITRLHRRIESLTADLERVRRRTSETVEAARREERVRLLSGLGEVLAAVDRALSMGDPEGPWRQGLEAIRGQLHAYLRGEGASLTGEVGEKMDPRLHQAISAEETDEFDNGHIVRVDRAGIVLDDDTVVSPALVVVAK